MKLIFSLKLPRFFYLSLLLLLSATLLSAVTPSLHSFKWKVITVQDSQDTLPYETNGEGPGYREDDVRFKELQMQEPPHPDMPDEEPKVLLEMEEKFSSMLGIPRITPRKHFGLSNVSIDEVQTTLMTPKLIEQDFRFAQINADSRLSNKDKEQMMAMNSQIHNAWDTVSFTNSWASSVYTYRWWWYYHSYPASNAINGWSYWCSTGGHSPDQIVTWQGDFERIRRIANLWIRWAYAPGYLSVQTTADGKTWEERIPWREAAKSKAAQASRSLFWWWEYNARSYAESVVFEEPIWVSGVRILMKDPVFYYFGIYQVKAWTKQWLVQLKSGQNLESDDCLNVNNGGLQNGAEITVRNCIEAIQQGDGRELFVLQNNMEITSYNQDFCMESSNGDLTDNSRIQLYECKAILSCCNDGREKWLLDPKGYMKNMKNTDKCMTIKGSEIELQQLGQVVAEASATMNDGQHEPKMAIDGAGESSFWASQPGVEKVEFKVIFAPNTVKDIEITWKYIPEHFEVLCNINGYWKSFLSTKENSQATAKVNVGTKTISGIKILLIKASEEAKFNDKVIYGITEIKIKTGARTLHLMDCNAESNSQLNKWFVDDANFVDVTPPPKLAAEFKKLYENTNRLLDLVHVIISWPPRIEQMMAKAKLIASQAKKIEDDINGIDLKLEQFKAQNLQDEENEAKKDCTLASTGSSAIHPAHSCPDIKKLYPYKMSGYYWIQPECAKVAIRVFCDFTNSETGIDYAYYGGIGDSVMKSKIKSVEDVRYYCAKLGLFPVQLKSKDQIQLIRRYLVDIGVNLQSKGFVPLGIDYGCQRGQCSGKYNSLNMKSTPDITDALKSMLDGESLLTRVFTQISQMFHAKSNDLIGFGLSKSGLIANKFSSNVPIKGIVCSTNADLESESSWLKIDCDTKARGNSQFDGITNTIIKAICPANCQSTGSSQVFGTEVFSDDSSVCKAGIHNGVLNSEEGGKLLVSITEGKESYLGSEAFGVRSEGRDSKWDRSFITDRYTVTCPIDNFKGREKDAKSFLEIADSTYGGPNFGGLTSNLKGKANQMRNKAGGATAAAKNAATGALNAVSNAANQGKNMVNEAASTVSNLGDQASNAANNAIDSAAGTASNLANQAAQGISEALGGGNSQSATADSEQKGTDIKIGGRLDSTDEAIEKLVAMFDMDKIDVANQVRLVKDTSELIDKVRTEFGPLANSNLSPEYQSQYLDTLSVHLKGSQIEMNKILVKAALKVKKRQEKRLKLRLEKLKYLAYDPYVENYDLNLEDMYDIHDFAQASNKPSKWSFSKSSLNGHATAIAQTSDIQINGDPKQRFASILKLKYKNFFDGRIAVSMLAKDTGRVGIAFRFLDEFNFYVFEMERGNGGLGFKQIRKFVNGEPTVLATENDGGYLQDRWYRIVIDFSMGKFTVRMDEETEKNTNPDYEDQMTKVLEGFDGDFAQGGFAFLTNSMAGVYFDRFSVKPNKCIDQSKNQSPNLYVPNTCSRFKESFFTDLGFLWKSVDPENNKNGPSVWEYKKEVKGKNHAIVQSSLTYGADSSKSPALLELKISKVCHQGLIQAEVVSEDNDGFIGVAFHYENSKNHYTFEVKGGEKERFCQVRKASDGSYKVLQKTEDAKKCGYDVDKWLSITIKITSNEWIFYISKEKEGLTEVLKMEPDQELQQGSIALLTYNTKAAFSAVKMMPLDDFEFKGLPSIIPLPNQETPPNPPQDEKKQEEPPKGNPKEKQAEYEGCLDKSSPEERDKYCQNKFGEDKAAVVDCKGNFCDRCCEDNMDNIHPQKLFHCKKTCKGLSQSDKESDEWNLCVASPRPTLSIYQYCEATQSGEAEKNRCKIDFCNLCCTVADGVFKRKFADESIESCHKECMENFSDNKDVRIPNSS